MSAKRLSRLIAQAVLFACLLLPAGSAGASSQPVPADLVTADRTSSAIDAAQAQVWYDPFSGPLLRSGWFWIDEDPTHWSLTARPGFLRIITQDPYPNRLVRALPAEDFWMETRLLFQPSQNFQFAGLLVYKDQNNFLNFGRAYCDFGPPQCVGNGIYFDYAKDGALTGSNFATNIASTGEIYLQLLRLGDTYTASASANGTQWSGIGEHEIDFTPIGIGLFANNQSVGASQINADFDFFQLVYPLAKVFLPVTLRSNP